jgi:hypothetical protein
MILDYISCNTVYDLQHEGEALARKNGELEATVRKLRISNREMEAECEKAHSRFSCLEKSVGIERERLEQLSATSMQQVHRQSTASQDSAQMIKYSSPMYLSALWCRRSVIAAALNEDYDCPDKCLKDYSFWPTPSRHTRRLPDRCVLIGIEL